MAVRSSGGGLFWEAGVDISKLREGFKQGTREAQLFARNIDRQGDRVNRSFTQYSKGVNTMNLSLKGMGQQLMPLVGVAGGAGLLLMLGNQLKQAGTEAYNFSVDYEMAMKEVSTISKAVREDFQGISQDIVNLAANGPDGAVELAKAYYQIVSAGYDGAEGLELLEVASRSATAGITDTKTAADGITTVMNAWGKSFEEAESIADQMFKTVEKGKTTFPELASNIANVAPIASTLKIPFEQIMGLTATITKQGTPTSQALTQIRSALVGLSRTMGGDIFQQGLTIQEVFQGIAESAEYSVEGITELTGRVEGASAILAVTGNKLKGAMQDYEDVSDSVGSMNSAYELMMEAVENKWLQVHNKWERAIERIGDKLKIASGSLADFFNELLTDREADIIDPAVSSEIKAFNSQLAQIEDREEKLRLLTEKMIELQNKSRELSSEQNKLQGQTGGSLQRAAEGITLGAEWALKATTGMELWDGLTPGHQAYQQLEKVSEQFAINQKLEKEVARLYQRILKETGENTTEDGSGGGGTTEQVKTLSDYHTQIKELKEQLGTGTIEQDVELFVQISNVQGKIDDLNDQVREKLKEYFDTADPIELEKSIEFSGSVKETPKVLVDTQKEMQKVLKRSQNLTKEQREQLEAINKQNNQLADQEELTRQLKEGFAGAHEILGAMSYAVGEVDRDLGQAIGKMADLAMNAGNLITNLSSGNYIGAIASGIGMIGNVFGMMNKDNTQEYISNSLDRIGESISRTNDLLNYQMNLLSDIEGADWFEAAAKNVESLNKELNKTKNDLQDITVWNKSRRYSTKVDTSDWAPEDYLKALQDTARYSFEGMDEGAKQLVDQWVNLENQIKTIEEEKMFRRLGFDSGDLAQSILSGVQEGLQLSEDGLGDWSETFGERVKKALSQNMLDALNDRMLVNFMDEFNTAMEDGRLDGDMDGLRQAFIAAVKEAENLWADLSPVLDEFGGGEDGGYDDKMVGAWQTVTRDQADLIAGQFTGMRFDLKDMSVSMNEMVDYSMESLNLLQDIADNTYRLVSVEEQLKEMNGYLRDGV